MHQIGQIQNYLDENPELLKKFVDVLYFTGNDIRFRMLYMICKRERVIKEISEVMVMSTAAVSQHLQKLKQANLVQGRTVKKVIHYSIHEENAKILRSIFREFDRLATE